VFVDTHCHLGDAQFDADRAEVLRRARDAGVHHVVVIGESPAGTQKAITTAREHRLSVTAGVHPHEASSWTPEVARAIEAALGDPDVVAVGETGLDYHYDFSPRPVQRDVFSAQLDLAARTGRPAVVHCREADNDMAAMLRETRATVVLHSFSAGRDVFDAGMAIGAYFSFSGMVTFRNWTLSDCLAACPPDRLLIETDAPYLAPVPYRGKRNEPAYVRHVATRVAELRGETIEEIASSTTTNAARLFGARLLDPGTISSGG
jgi:TatD DNase family protein